MAIPETIQKLIHRFEHNQAAYRLGDYKEASLRLEFLDPFFETLGWQESSVNE